MSQNDNAYKLALKLKNYKVEKPKLIKALGITTRDHFRLNFKKQGFDDAGVTAWKKRSFEFSGKSRSVLTNRGKLRDSINYQVRASSTIISNSQDYARIHNEGGSMPVTAKMRSFFWAMFYQAQGSAKKPNPDALIWRNMAMKKGNTITIPQRQFMGHSQNLNKKLDRQVKQTLKKI
jgi:phage gpG-like protein